jgi:hypothetical protein
MEVSGQLHTPAALPPGKEPLVPTEQEAEWAPEMVWTRGEEQENSEPLPGLEPPIIQPVAQRYTTEQVVVLYILIYASFDDN